MRRESPRRTYSVRRLVALLIVPILLTPGCNPTPELRIIQLQVDESEDGWFGPLEQWGLYFGPGEEGGPVHFLRREEGDFLLPVGDDEMALLTIRPSDGDILRLAANEPTVTLGGRPVAIFLDDEDDWVWLGDATPEEKASLRAIAVAGELTPERTVLLRDLAAHNPDLDVATETEDLIPVLLELFDPEVAVLGEMGLEARETDPLPGETRLRTLMVPGYEIHGLDFLPKLPTLETLFISEWDPEEIGALPGDLPALRSIILSDPSIDDLESLGSQPDLRRLVIYDCDVDAESGVLDIGAVTRYSRLELLAFRDCDVGDLRSIGTLPRLRWLGLAREATQEQLNQVVELAPDLTVLELFGEEELTDLTPLTELRSLKGLMVGSGAPVEPLLQMDHLQYLGVWAGNGEEESFSEEEFELLKAELPETTVTLVAPFCLGSGLILLLIPMIGSFVVLLGRRQEDGLSAARHD